MVNDSKAFLDEVAGYVTSPEAVNRLGTIDAAYTSGRPRVLFDGETVLGAKTYPYVAAYAPRAGERVLLAPMGSGFVILGAIDTVSAPAFTLPGTVTASGTQSIVRRNGLVSAAFRFTTSAAIGQFGVIATLPAGYRPNPAGIDLHFGGSMQPSGGAWATMVYYVSAPDGAIRCLLSGVASGATVTAVVPSFVAGA